MEHEGSKHEKIRFRRDEIASLSALPSFAVQDPAIGRLRPRKKRRLRRAFVGVTAVVVLLVIALSTVFALGVSGVGSERLRREAEAAIRQFSGIAVDAAMGPARFSVDSSRFLGIELRDVSLVTDAEGAEIIEAGAVRFGIRFMPLLSGELKLGSAAIENARIVPAAIGATGPRDWTAGLTDEQGLIDPDKLASAVFDAAEHAFAIFEQRATRSVDFENVEILLPPNAPAQSILVREATLTHSGAELLLQGEIAVDGQTLVLDGSIARNADGQGIEKLHLGFSAEDFVLTFGKPGGDTELSGALTATLTGTQAGGRDRLVADMTVDGAEIGGDPKKSVQGTAELTASLTAGTGKVEIDKAVFSSGRSRLAFNGALGPAPAEPGRDGAPVYRFELVSNNSTLAPESSPEPALPVGARIAGTYDAAARRLTVSDIGVRTGPGEMAGRAIVTFADGKAPALDFAMTIPQMPVAHAKQLWPWLAARGARKWALKNVYGGLLRDSNLRIVVSEGRIGNGVPFSAEEMWGRFAIADARFDVAGRIPPVRDASGSVFISGTDVEIFFDAGTVFMPSGRSVAASGGTFTIRDAHEKPLVGSLDIEVHGEAPAVIELASYEPINATGRLGLSPEDFTGRVKGRVKADVPLQKDGSFGRLAWDVAMSYEELSVAKPFEGQTVTEATGTIELQPTWLAIDAKAKLNGIPAEISLVNPLGNSDVKRERRVILELDDMERDILAPGLASIVSGPFTAELTLADDAEGVQDVRIDLSEARLQIPWAGWSKGPGIAAEASFRLSSADGAATLSDFKLAGKSFSAAGAIELKDGGLASASFDDVRLNRDDDFSLDLTRSGEGYAAVVRGASADVRSLVKQVLSEGQGAAAGPRAKGVAVTVDARIDTVLGFGGEMLTGMSLAYSGTGSSVGELQIEGVLASGAKVSVDNSTQGGARTVAIASADAGATLRFLDIYRNMQGGQIDLVLEGSDDGILRGRLRAREFVIANEGRLGSIVSTAPAGDGRSLNQAIRSDIDTSRVSFERGFAMIEKGPGYLKLDRGVLRGPLIGTTFQGTVYDKQGEMDLTGTFMPAYGLNRLFAEIPLLGGILGNGRDRGLIGITYKLSGDAKSPDLLVNPLSVVAPGIFRNIFEFN